MIFRVTDLRNRSSIHGLVMGLVLLISDGSTQPYEDGPLEVQQPTKAPYEDIRKRARVMTSQTKSACPSPPSLRHKLPHSSCICREQMDRCKAASVSLAAFLAVSTQHRRYIGKRKMSGARTQIERGARQKVAVFPCFP
eukprot:422239-Amphidinium_carterae.2